MDSETATSAKQNGSRSRLPTVAPGRAIGLAVGLAVLAASLPPVLGWAFVARAPSVSPAEASYLLRADDSRYVLVDVRSEDAYAQASIQGSTSLPYSQIRQWTNAADLPATLQGRSLVLLCDGGVLSARAALRLQALGASEAYSVRGGLQAWIASASTSDALLPLRVDGQEEAALSPVVRLPVAEQATLVLALYAVKPLYMLLAVWIVWALWPKKTIVLTALRWSLIGFLVGELACWVNFQFLTVESITLEYVHSFSMTFFIALLVSAIIGAIDRDLLHYTAPAARCALAGYCHRCRKSTDVTCVLRRLSQLGCVSLAALSLIPLTAAPHSVSYNAGIFGLVRNLMHPVAVQLYEIRFAPVAACVLFASAWLLLAFGGHKGENSALVLIAAGTGHLGFAFFRLAFLSFFPGDLVRFVAWEELTELLMIAALAYALWVFRVELLPRRSLHRLLG